MSSPYIRVSRKRAADPHEALILNYKRAKTAAPLVFTLFKSSAEKNEEEPKGANVVDLPKHENEEEMPETSENPLGFVKDEAVGLVGEPEKSPQKNQTESVSLNGRVMQTLKSGENPEDVVYDYYRIQENRGATWSPDMDISKMLDVRFANRNELDLIMPQEAEDEDSDGPRADDDDDSNDEDNWRNDYPDEDSYDENSEGDPYGELVAENWHGECPGDNLNRHFQNIAINDSYEAYWQGEETEDEEDY